MKRTLATLLAFIITINLIAVDCYAANEESIDRMATAESLVTAYENMASDTISDSDLCLSVYDDLSLLEVAHLDKLVEISKIDEAGNIIYQASFGEGIINDISVSSNNAGDVILNIREGSLSNELVYASNGSIYVDGVFAFSMKNASSVTYTGTESDSLARAGARTNLFAISLPEGNKSVPSIFKQVSSTIGTQVSLGKKLALLTAGVIISLTVSAALGTAVTAMGVASVIVSTVLTEALTLVTSDIIKLKTAYPNSDKMSYRMYTYARNGNNSLYSEFIYSFYLYGTSDCTGTVVYAGAKKVLEAT